MDTHEDSKRNAVPSQDIQEQSQQLTCNAFKKQQKMMCLYLQQQGELCCSSDKELITALFSPAQKSWIGCRLLKRTSALGVMFLNNLPLLIPLNSGVKNRDNWGTPQHWLTAQPFTPFTKTTCSCTKFKEYRAVRLQIWGSFLSKLESPGFGTPRIISTHTHFK